jgi:hypothetical protein
MLILKRFPISLEFSSAPQRANSGQREQEPNMKSLTRPSATHATQNTDRSSTEVGSNAAAIEPPNYGIAFADAAPHTTLQPKFLAKPANESVAVKADTNAKHALNDDISRISQQSSQQPIQRRIIRMPDVYGDGTEFAANRAEINEMQEALIDKGKDDGEGVHNWKDDWKFADGRVNYFIGHGNRTRLGGVSPTDFASAAVDPIRDLRRDTAIKIMACGGGLAAAEKSSENAYGNKVSAALSKKNRWQGALKATQGYLYHTKAFKLIMPSYPDSVAKRFSELSAEGDVEVFNDLPAIIESELDSDDIKSLAMDMHDNLLKMQTTLLADRTTSVPENFTEDDKEKTKAAQMIENAATKILYINHDDYEGDNKLLLTELLHAAATMVDEESENEEMLPLEALISHVLKPTDLSTYADKWENVQSSIEADWEIQGQKVWDTFKVELEAAGKHTFPDAIKTTGEKLETDPGKYDKKVKDPGLFKKYQNFGPMSWQEWKQKYVKSAKA